MSIPLGPAWPSEAAHAACPHDRQIKGFVLQTEKAAVAAVTAVQAGCEMMLFLQKASILLIAVTKSCGPTLEGVNTDTMTSSRSGKAGCFQRTCCHSWNSRCLLPSLRVVFLPLHHRTCCGVMAGTSWCYLKSICNSIPHTNYTSKKLPH